MANWTVVLTGGIGSGKSLVAGLFAQRNVAVVEQDELSREIVEPGQPALQHIVTRFGANIIDSEGRLNRAELRKRIFADPRDRIWLNQLTHPLINELTWKRVRDATTPYALVVNPLLGGRSSAYDRFLVVDVPTEIQVARTMQRDNISQALARKMIDSQTDRVLRLKIADDVIRNDGTIAQVEERVASLHRRYLFMAIR